MKLPQNNNNFPSKIMEYLAAGRIIISTKFPGYELFKDNIIFYESETQLNEILLDLDKTYDDIYIKAYHDNRKFAEQFYWAKQVEKIESILNS